jgi:hypothetical protein
LREVNGSKLLRIGPKLNGKVVGLRVYERHLLTSEAVGNWRAGAS